MTNSEIKNLLNQINDNLRAFYAILKPFQDKNSEISFFQNQKLTSHINYLNIIEDEIIEYRLRKVIKEEHPYMPEIDLDRINNAVRSRQLQLYELIEEFLKQRQELIEMLNNTPTSDWNRTGVLSYEGHVTLYDLVLRFQEKAEHNLKDLQKIAV